MHARKCPVKLVHSLLKLLIQTVEAYFAIQCLVESEHQDGVHRGHSSSAMRTILCIWLLLQFRCSL